MRTFPLGPRSAAGLWTRPSVPIFNRRSPQAQGLVIFVPMVLQALGSNLADPNSPFSPTNTPVLRPGPGMTVGYAGLFEDSASQYLRLAAAPVSTTPLTIACWFAKVDTAVNSSLVTIDDSNDQKFALAALGAGDAVRFVAEDGTTSAGMNTTTSIGDRLWHHACGVATSSTDRAVFLDGRGKNTSTTSITPSGLNETLVAAAYNGGVLGTFADAMIAHVCVWNRALSDAEVWALYDPRTRWDLYQIPSRRVFVNTVAAGVTWPVPPLMDYYHDGPPRGVAYQ